MASPAAVGRLLTDTFHGTPLERRLAEARIWEIWDSVVGEQIAHQARPNAMRDNVLTVMVASAPWMQQLNFLKGEIQGRLNSALGAELIRDIYLKAGKPPRTNQSVQPVNLPERHLTLTEQNEIKATVATISDEELRSACQRLLTIHHRRH
jgi:predicted nucleic acid-binding Zn ribbon protein